MIPAAGTQHKTKEAKNPGVNSSSRLFPDESGPIGVFDSGYGGLTILGSIRRRLPQHDYLYFGDNARAPYGQRSFDLVLEFTRQAVEELFARGCHLVILACNTASAKALRSIQQEALPKLDPERRVLGVIRPTVERLGTLSRSRHVGVLATQGTVASGSYGMEIDKLYGRGMHVSEKAAPMWVPLIENGEADGPGADYFVKKYVDGLMGCDPQIDTVILGCTHYPILMPKIRMFAPAGVKVVAQGDIVAESLEDYLSRHPEMERKCTKNGGICYLTTESPEKFDALASGFMGMEVRSDHVSLR